MYKFPVNFDSVSDSISKKRLKYAEVKDQFQKICFDVFYRKGSNPENLWQIQQNADDGNDYIVALYNEDEDKIATANAPPDWSVFIKNAELHIFYKKEHLCKVSAIDLGFVDKDLELAKQYLPRKLADNKNLVKILLNTIDPITRQNLSAKYPELKNV